MKYLLIASMLMFAPLLVQVTTGIDMQTAANAAAERRKVPPMKEKTYKAISEAQMLIDPESIPVAEGETREPITPDPRRDRKSVV